MTFAALRRAAPWIVLTIAVLAGCASGPTHAPGTTRPALPDRDGAEATPPADLARVPDAEPMLESIRNAGPNKPYDVLGRSYVPITRDAPFTERGLASWYGKKFHGKRTASGEIYNMYAMTAAHPTLPVPSYARVHNPANGRDVVVRINDRGPFHPGRIIDLSYIAALKLDLLRGVGTVELQRITFEDICTGAWRREATTDVAVAAPASAPTSAPQPELVATVTAPAVMPPAEAASATQLADAPSARAFTMPARGFWVQLGAFRQREGAQTFQQRVIAELDWLAPLLAVFVDASMFRLQAGPYPSRADARVAAERIRGGLQLVPVIVERR